MSKRIVDCYYLVSSINQCYRDQENNLKFSMKGYCDFYRKSRNAEEELCSKKFGSINKNLDL